MTSSTIRAATASDTAALMNVAEASGLFSSDELAGFADMTHQHFADLPPDHHWLALIKGDQITGAAYVTPEAMTDGVWNLWFIGLPIEARGQGGGGKLLAAAEALAREAQARLMLIETASGAEFEATRGFYLAKGYRQEAVIAHYYAPDVDKVFFRKSL